MKRFFTFLLVFIMMVGSIGVNESLHYCGGEAIGFVMNGFTYQNEKGKMMAGCMDGHARCKHCKTVYHSYRLHSSFVQGSQVQVQPALAYGDWFHGLLGAFVDLTEVETEMDGEAFGVYRSPYHSLKIPISSGLRAPPAFA